MIGQGLRKGGTWYAGGLLCTGAHVLLDRFSCAAPIVNGARGFLDGLAVVAFGTAIYSLARQARLIGGK
jgi:predicted metal-binding membrane protein